MIDNAVGQASHLYKLICETPGFRPAFPEVGFNCTNVCFHYVPPRMRTAEAAEDEQFWQELSTVPPRVKEALIRKGSLMIGYQPLPHKGMGNFFRMVVHAVPRPSEEDMRFVIEEIDRVGRDL